MKRFLSLIATICMLATACEGNLFGDQNNDDKNGGSLPKISLSQTKVNVACTDGVYSVKVASPYSWEAQSKNSWIVIDEDACTGIAGSDEVLEFRVEANESEKVRKGTIVIKNSDFQLITELYIAQAAQGQSLEELEKEEGKNEGGNGSGNEGENQGGGGVENEGGNGNPDTPIKEKRLVKVVSGQTDPTTYTFEYDNEGRLIKVVESWEKDTYSDVCTSSYEWGFNKIDVKQVSCSSDGSESYTSTAICSYILDNNGLVTEYTNSDKYINCTIKYYYTYNESNRLTSVTGTDSNDAFVWSGDKLTTYKWYDDVCTLTYGKTCKRGYNIFLGEFIQGGYELIMGHPELFGARTKQLQTTVILGDSDGDSETQTFEYEFDSEGYVSKITTGFEDDGQTYCEPIFLTWE